MKIVGITACPSGVAHTYMAAEALVKAGKKKGLDIKVETQGSMGLENEITPEEARNADLLIIAADMGLKKMERFNGVPRLKVGVGFAIRNADKVIEKAIEVVNQRKGKGD